MRARAEFTHISLNPTSRTRHLAPPFLIRLLVCARAIEFGGGGVPRIFEVILSSGGYVGEELESCRRFDVDGVQGMTNRSRNRSYRAALS